MVNGQVVGGMAGGMGAHGQDGGRVGGPDGWMA